MGILATDGTIQTGLYQKELTAAGLTPVTPAGEAAEDGDVHHLRRDQKRGRPAPGRSSARWTPRSARLAVTAPSWACTELSVYRALHSLPPYYMDAMEVLAEQAILRCGKQLRNV